MTTRTYRFRSSTWWGTFRPADPSTMLSSDDVVTASSVLLGYPVWMLAANCYQVTWFCSPTQAPPANESEGNSVWAALTHNHILDALTAEFGGEEAVLELVTTLLMGQVAAEGFRHTVAFGEHPLRRTPPYLDTEEVASLKGVLHTLQMDGSLVQYRVDGVSVVFWATEAGNIARIYRSIELAIERVSTIDLTVLVVPQSAYLRPVSDSD